MRECEQKTPKRLTDCGLMLIVYSQQTKSRARELVTRQVWEEFDKTPAENKSKSNENNHNASSDRNVGSVN